MAPRRWGPARCLGEKGGQVCLARSSTNSPEGASPPRNLDQACPKSSQPPSSWVPDCSEGATPQLGAQAQVAGILVLGAPEDRLNSFQGQLLLPPNMSGVTHLPVSLSTMSPPSGSLGRQRYDRSRTQISSLTDWGGFGVRAQVLKPPDFRQDETEGQRGPVPCPNTTVHWWQRWD